MRRFADQWSFGQADLTEYRKRQKKDGVFEDLITEWGLPREAHYAGTESDSPFKAQVSIHLRLSLLQPTSMPCFRIAG